MVLPVNLGPPNLTDEIAPAVRRRDGRAIVPLTGETRAVEIFDARPVLNRRAEIITRGNSSFRFLRFARIALDPSRDRYAPVTLEVGTTEEAVFYVNRGSVRVQCAGEVHELGPGDVVYAGLGETVMLSSEGYGDVSEYRAIECHTKYPVQLVRRSDIIGTKYVADVGSKRPMTKRTIYKLVDQNVQACRLLFGDTYVAQPGAVGSYPPHFHGPEGPQGLGQHAKEEIYHFRCTSEIPGDRPYVLQNCARPGESVNTYVHLFDDEAINVTPNFHDTVAPAAVLFSFTWCLGSFRENHRDWTEIVTRPGYENEW
jgi:4-deoxy-L-threo-5-hexosulose-uronate ketol-isomerase